MKRDTMQSTTENEGIPTTSYRGSEAIGINGTLPPIPTDETPSTPPSTSSTTNLGRRRLSPNSTVTSLLPEDETNGDIDYHNEGLPPNLLDTQENDRCGDFEDVEGQRASITGMICMKSKAFMFGQMLSLFLAATGAVQSSLYLDCGLSAPTFSMLSFYLPLCIICTLRLFRQARDHQHSTLTDDNLDDSNKQQVNGVELELKTNYSDESFHENNDGVLPTTSDEEHDDPKLHSILNDEKRSTPYSLCKIIPLHSPPWKYAAVAIADVYANYTTILAFKYTTITSVSLFDALAIPSAMLISKLFFGRTYTKVHLLAVAVCCIGISINVFQDYRENERMKESGGVGETAQEELVEEEYPYKLAGDALAITGGVLFGVSNTLAEVAVRDWGSQDEFVSAMSFFASIITFVQTLFTERQEVKAFFSTSESNDTCSELGSLTLLALFVVATVVNYLGIASFLGMSDAAFLNLSLLTGDAWAVAFSVFAEGIIPPPTFYVALVITVSGVFIYETAPSPHQQARVNGENEIEMDELGKRSNVTGHVLT